MTELLEAPLEYKSKSFVRNLIVYFGPALVVSVAYMDPGNYGTDIVGGSSFGYTMLWVVWLAGIMAMMLQYLSGKLGIATGHSLPTMIRLQLKEPRYIIPYWLASEAAAAMTDLAEFLGTVIALNLLFGVPLIYGTFLSVLDVLLILGITRGRARRLEYAFLFFVSVIGFGYLYEIFLTAPNTSGILRGSIIPALSTVPELLLAVGVIGATVMPHAVFLHSALTNDRVTDPRVEFKKQVLRLHQAESVIMFTMAGLVNAAIMIMAAAAFYPTPVPAIDQAYRTLLPLFGPSAAVIFGITLLASGLSSSTTGTLAGQAIMEGMLGRKINPWMRRLVTRFVNTIPTTIAILLGLNPLVILLYSQVGLSLLLPLPLVPLWWFTRKKELMGVFANRRITTVLAGLFVLLIIGLNVMLLYFTFTGTALSG
jgi:manganese transport protein